MNEANPAQLVPYVTGGAFALAFIFGAVGNKTNFCTMGRGVRLGGVSTRRRRHAVLDREHRRLDARAHSQLG